MSNYIVDKNAQLNGDYEVHDEASTRGCLPVAANRISLGYHLSCSSAVTASNNLEYRPANGCYYCAYGYHTA